MEFLSRIEEALTQRDHTHNPNPNSMWEAGKIEIEKASKTSSSKLPLVAIGCAEIGRAHV